MEIFNWANDIENVYKNLIKKAQDDALAEIQALRNNQEKMIEFALNKKRELINLALKNLSKEMNQEIKEFKEKLEEIMKKTEEQYQKNKDNLVESLIEKLDLRF